MIITSEHSILNPFDDFFGSDDVISRTLSERRHNEVKKAKESLNSKLVTCDNRCSLEEVKVELVSRGMREEKIEHLKNEMIDQLVIEYNASSKIILRQPLFPKMEHIRSIIFEIHPYKVNFRIDPNSTPESIADMIIAAMEWIPEYVKIDEEIKIEIKQAEMAREMSVDLLKRVVGAILTAKGYEYELYSRAHSNNASLRIAISNEFSIEMEITFNGNFLDQVVRYVEVMPIKEAI